MEENIFFDTRRLKHRGSNVIIGKTVRIRFPELVELHDNVIIDDFTYISSGLIMKEHSFIESHCTFMGGPGFTVTLGNYSAISSSSVVVCSGLDLRKSLHINHNKDLLTPKTTGNVELKDHVIVGSHSTITANLTIGTGNRVGAYGFVNKSLDDEWSLYTGIPVKKIGEVDRESILNQLSNYHKRITV
jgi:galactoside O-acetyltransferase